MVGRPRLKSSAALLMALLLIAPATRAEAAEVAGRASIIDGDTIEIRGERLRLEGIDAFEARQHCMREGKAWPCGRRAAFALAEKLSSSNVRCTWAARDRYRRALATCFLGAENINAWLVREGWALAYRQYSKAYVEEEAKAKAAGAGAWTGTFAAPWDYRGR